MPFGGLCGLSGEFTAGMQLARPHDKAHSCFSSASFARPLMVWYGTVRYGTVRYGTVRYGTVRYGTVRYGTVRYGMVYLFCRDSTIVCQSASVCSARLDEIDYVLEVAFVDCEHPHQPRIAV